jgi:hypothetical protein
MKDLKREIFLEVILMLYLIMTLAFFWKNNLVCSLLIIAGLCFTFIIRSNKADGLSFLAGAVIGSLGEIIVVNSGAWNYSNPTIAGIPLWLPLAWAMTCVLIYRFGETASKFKE